MEDAVMKIRRVLVFLIFVLACSLSAKADKTGTVRGIVDGPGSTLLADAEISLTNKAGGDPLVTSSDEEGEFLFENVPPGDYVLLVKSPGFQDAQLPVTVGSTALPHLRVKMKVAQVSDQVTVSASAQPVLLAGENKNAVDITSELLRNMPVKNGDYLAIPSLFLDNSMLGAEGPKLIVDGVEVNQEDLPASSIKDIVVNRNPFSAEFGRPGKGRLEITTKKGVHSRYRGTILGVYRNSDLYAREAFATDKPFQDRKLVEGEVDGPLPFLKKATFFVSGRYRSFGDVAVVNALTPSGPLVTNRAVPLDALGLLGRLDVRFNPNHKMMVFYRFKNKTQDNQLASNFDLPEHATTLFNHGNELRVFETANFSSNVMNQIRVGYKADADNISSATNQPSIVVLGAFSSGGAQVSQAKIQRNGELEDVASVSSGRHLFRFGAGIRSKFFHVTDASNFGGTYTFSNLTDFENSTPFLYTINTGNPSTSFSWTENYAFFQDDIHLRHNLALFAGLRQEFQSSVPYAQNLAPRLAVAYSPGDGKTVIRGGVGIYYDREPLDMVSQSRLYGGNITETVIPNPTYPSLGLTGVTQTVPSIVRIEPVLRSPYLVHASVSAEHQLGRGQNFLTLELGTIRGVELYRTRNVNAPFPGTTIPPDPNFNRIDQFESSASSRGYSASISYRGQFRKLQLIGHYTLARTLDSASTMTSRPANNYDANADWGRADYDRRHQLNFIGLYSLPKSFRASIVFSAGSGLPYDITTGSDDNGDTIANDRPAGLWRNAGRGPGYLNIDMRLSRRYRLMAKREHAPTFEWAIDAFNVLNHVNYDNYVGDLQSAFFRRANGSLPARQVQLSARFSF